MATLEIHNVMEQITPLGTSPITPEAWKLLSRLPSLHRIPTTINSLPEQSLLDGATMVNLELRRQVINVYKGMASCSDLHSPGISFRF